MKLKPLADRVILKMVEAEETTFWKPTMLAPATRL